MRKHESTKELSRTCVEAAFLEEVVLGAESDSGIDDFDSDDMKRHAIYVEFKIFLEQSAAQEQCCGSILDGPHESYSKDG